jgi:hypothetical protein
MLELVFHDIFVKLRTKDEWVGGSSKKITGWRKSNSGRSALGPNRREPVLGAVYLNTTTTSTGIKSSNMLMFPYGTYHILSSVEAELVKNTSLALRHWKPPSSP